MAKINMALFMPWMARLCTTIISRLHGLYAVSIFQTVLHVKRWKQAILVQKLNAIRARENWSNKMTDKTKSLLTIFIVATILGICIGLLIRDQEHVGTFIPDGNGSFAEEERE